MNINLKVQGAVEVQDALTTLERRTAAQAVLLWSNWLGLEAQGAMRDQLGTRFKLRGTADGFKKAVVFRQARKSGDRTAKAELAIGGLSGGASKTAKLGILLAKHEEAETRTRATATELAPLFAGRKGKGARMPQGGFFLPARGTRTSSANPPRSLYPLALAKSATKGKGASRVVYFATDKGIFRRSTTRMVGQRQVQAVWWFSRKVSTPARLGLWDTAQRVFEDRSTILGLQAVDEALFRAKL